MLISYTNCIELLLKAGYLWKPAAQEVEAKPGMSRNPWCFQARPWSPPERVQTSSWSDSAWSWPRPRSAGQPLAAGWPRPWRPSRCPPRRANSLTWIFSWLGIWSRWPLLQLGPLSESVETSIYIINWGKWPLALQSHSKLAEDGICWRKSILFHYLFTLGLRHHIYLLSLGFCRANDISLQFQPFSLQFELSQA